MILNKKTLLVLRMKKSGQETCPLSCDAFALIYSAMPITSMRAVEPDLLSLM